MSTDKKKLEDLNLLDRFLFNVVMEDSQNCKDILEIIIGEELPLLKHVHTEKEFMVIPEAKGIRMDVWAIDEDQTLYNAEMQGKNQGNLMKRERLYQAHLDVTLLAPGEQDYGKLNDSYMIMIMPFDLFGKKRYRYTCRMHCVEAPDVSVDTGAVWIFLNTKGVIADGVNQELIDFLHYVENSTEKCCCNTGSERIRRIHEQVQQIKRRKEIGVKYMTDLEEKMFIREEGREEGRKEGREEGCESERLRLNQLTRLLLQDGRTSDILRGTEDHEYQKSLLAEYGI